MYHRLHRSECDAHLIMEGKSVLYDNCIDNELNSSNKLNGNCFLSIEESDNKTLLES